MSEKLNIKGTLKGIIETQFAESPDFNPEYKKLISEVLNEQFLIELQSCFDAIHGRSNSSPLLSVTEVKIVHSKVQTPIQAFHAPVTNTLHINDIPGLSKNEELSKDPNFFKFALLFLFIHEFTHSQGKQFISSDEKGFKSFFQKSGFQLSRIDNISPEKHRIQFLPINEAMTDLITLMILRKLSNGNTSESNWISKDNFNKFLLRYLEKKKDNYFFYCCLLIYIINITSQKSMQTTETIFHGLVSGYNTGVDLRKEKFISDLRDVIKNDDIYFSLVRLLSIDSRKVTQKSTTVLGKRQQVQEWCENNMKINETEMEKMFLDFLNNVDLF